MAGVGLPGLTASHGDGSGAGVVGGGQLVRCSGAPRRMERPDYGGNRPEESAFARRGWEAMAEDDGWEVQRDAGVPLVIWDFVTGDDVNLEDLAWDRRLEG